MCLRCSCSSKQILDENVYRKGAAAHHITVVQSYLRRILTKTLSANDKISILTEKSTKMKFMTRCQGMHVEDRKNKNPTSYVDAVSNMSMWVFLRRFV